MAKYLAQIVVIGARIISQAFVRAVQQEYQAAKIASQRTPGNSRSSETPLNLKTGMNLEEAKQILNVDSKNLVENISEIEKKFEHLFQQNAKERGGSFYLQSKIIRAKERLDQEINFRKKLSDKKQKENKKEDI